MYKLKFPIGEYKPQQKIDEHILHQWVTDIESFPSKIEVITNGISNEQLNWKYRPDGWCIKQVVHHCADSHMNSLIRFKLALTESTPTIRPYFEDKWGELIDALDDDIQPSLMILKGLHQKWTKLLRSLTEKQLQMEFIHPEHGKKFTLKETIGIYAWHCNHHLAHITNAIAHDGRFN